MCGGISILHMGPSSRPAGVTWRPPPPLLLQTSLSSSLSCYPVFRQISFTYLSLSSPCSLRLRPQGRLLRASAGIACPTATNLSGPWFKGVKLGFPIFEKRINLPQLSPTYSISVTPHIRNETFLAIAVMLVFSWHFNHFFAIFIHHRDDEYPRCWSFF